MSLLILLLLAQQSIFSHAVLCNDCEVFQITFAGTPGISPMMKQWAFAYSLLRQDVGVEYTPIGGAPAYASLMSTCRDNYLLDAAFSDINYFLFNKYPGYNATSDLQSPFFAGALVLTLNVPEIAGQTLYLTREIVHKIYTQNITNWNDSRIIGCDKQNSGLKMPNQTIILVLGEGMSGPTVTIQTMVFNYDTETERYLGANKTNGPNYRNWPRDAKWPDFATWFNKSVYLTTKNDFSMVSQVLTTPYTLGYAPLSFVLQAGLPYALVANRFGTFWDPAVDLESIQAAVDNSIHFNKSQTIMELKNVFVADVTGNDSYPLTAFYYLVYHKYLDRDCTMRRETWKFINWILNSEAARKQIDATKGYAPFSDFFLQQVLNMHINPITCNGEKLLDYEFDETNKGVVSQIIIALAAVLNTIVAVFSLTLGYKRKNRITKAAGLAFSLSFLAGCFLNYTSIFFWAQVPDSDSNCQARYLLVSLGYSLVFGSMFAKCWEIRKALNEAKTGDISPFQELPWWKFLQVFVFVLSINVMLLIGLAAADPPHSAEREIDSLHRVAIHVCAVARPTVWIGLQFTYFGVLIVWGGYLAYCTRDIWERYNYPNESRSILMSIYNIVFCIVILFPLISVLKTNDDTVFFLTCVAILFPTSFCLFTVCGTKVVTIFGSSFHASQHSQHTSLTKRGHAVKENKAEKAHESTDETRRRMKSKSKQKDEKVEGERDFSDEDRPEDNLQHRQHRHPSQAGLRNTETVTTKNATEIVAPPQDDGAWNVS